MQALNQRTVNAQTKEYLMECQALANEMGVSLSMVIAAESVLTSKAQNDYLAHIVKRLGNLQDEIAAISDRV